MNWVVLLGSIVGVASVGMAEDRFDTVVGPAIAAHCVRCHGGEPNVRGDVDLKRITTAAGLLERPALLEKMADALDFGVMPPEGEPPLPEATRTKLLATLRTMLAEATANATVERNPVRRLNRFQYNNAVRDLFRLNRDVFPLPEKLMTRYGDHVVAANGRMPDRIDVACLSLDPPPGLEGVRAFPRDLRAAHGFDNQADQLTLSPLLLDTFLRLGVSIVESPDFDEETVGLWNDFFAAPREDTELRATVEGRLERFLRRAFRRPVEPTTRDRYTAYVLARVEAGTPFTEAMTKVAAAVLSSPKFLYRSSAEDGSDREFELASKLSFLLWASGPDEELLDLAERGELSAVLDQQVDRMLADPRIERFLDTFPAQWMQLDGVLAATPDPELSRLFSLEKTRPASTQMVLEPLLLFDAVLVENRPIVDLLAPGFSYRSDFLVDWYESDLEPPSVDVQAIVAENRRNDERRRALREAIAFSRRDLDELFAPVRERILATERKDGDAAGPVDLKPYAAWEFDGDLKASVGGFDLTSHGEIRFEDGMVELEGAYLRSEPLSKDLRTKSLEVWCRVPDIDQRGGGVMGIQGPGDFFDTIVLGEREPRRWISGSNGFSRTLDFPESTPEEQSNEPLHLVMVYTDGDETLLYRNGERYGKPFRKGRATFPRDQTSVLFGLRHLPPEDDRYLDVRIDRARLYDRALSADEVRTSFAGGTNHVSEQELLAGLTDEQREQRLALREVTAGAEDELARIPTNRDPNEEVQNAQRRFDDAMRAKLLSRTFRRVTADDPRYGGIVTNAAMLSMTSGPRRTHPIARGAWILEVVFNDPPAPPPNDVPPLNEEDDAHLTIRERFARHREHESCAGCHAKLDPLGFALENFDVVGRWRDRYGNGLEIDAGGTLADRRAYSDVVEFKRVVAGEERRFARAFTRHLIRFALARELAPADAPVVASILGATAHDRFRMRSILKAVVLSDAFARPEADP